jgi:GNAT superfamily N-acetyltransferase
MHKTVKKSSYEYGQLMREMKLKDIQLQFLPVTKNRWSDFETLFGERGACGGCWCMIWRLTRKEFENQKGEGNRKAMKAIIDAGQIPGILAFSRGKPVAWCSVAPRGHFPALGRSRILKVVDELPVWSISCLFVDKEYRKKGLSIQLLKAAVEFVKNQGGWVVEAYPVEPKKDKMPDVFAWTGLASAYKKAGFAECARRSETRPIMRFYIED